MIDRNRAASLLSDLVRIESVNPDLVSSGSGEARIARYVADFLQKAGLQAQVQDLGHGRANAVAVLRGLGGGRSLMLNGHLDTVGVAGMEAPFTPRVENGRMYGRGAQDMKSGIAAALLAVAVLAREKPLRGDVMVAAVADEEFKSVGTRALLQTTRADAAIVTEPTGLEIAIAHKGFAWAEVETIGKAAHGSRPRDGVDAIAMMGRVLGGIESLQDQLVSGHAHPLLGHASVHASIITGGQELSSYPSQCRLSLERRLLPGEDAASLQHELEQIVARCAARDPKFQARIALGYSALAMETPRESPIAQTLFRSAAKVMGKSPTVGAQSFWTDAALLHQGGIPSVLFGPGGAGLHSTEEYVILEDVVLCAETLVDCAASFCG